MDKNEELHNHNSQNEDSQGKEDLSFIVYNIDKSIASQTPIRPLSQTDVPEELPLDPQDNIDPNFPLDPSMETVIPVADKTPFVSNFKRWIRSVAIFVLIVFVPDQISWAFGYNPAVLYKNLPVTQAPMMGGEVETKILPQTQVSGSVEYLLKQIQGKENLRVELNIDSAEEAKGKTSKGSDPKVLKVETRKTFTQKDIAQITKWLSDPKLNVLNCGVYSLQELLNQKGINKTLEEIAILTVSSDLMADIIKVGEPKLKTTLFSITKVGEAFGLDYKPLKIDTAQELKLVTPFIAHLKGEHFVTVKKVTSQKVFIDDLGSPQILDRAEFEKQLSGFVYAKEPTRLMQSSFEEIPESMQAFVWGDKWRDLSQNLPGLVKLSDVLIDGAISIGAAIVTAGIGAWLKSIGTAAQTANTVAQTTAEMAQMAATMGELTAEIAMTAQIAAEAAQAFTFAAQFSAALGSAFVGMAASKLAGSLTTLCVMEGACDEDTAFILNIAISSALSAGAGAAGAAGSAAAASSSMASSAASTAMESFAINFSKGFALGVVKGYVTYQIYKQVSKAICDTDCSDSEKILQETLGTVVSSIGADIAIQSFAFAVDSMTGKTFDGKVENIDLKTESGKQAIVERTQSWSFGKMLGTNTESFGKGFSSLLKSEVPFLLGQSGSMAVRLVALQAGVKADSEFSQGLGSAANAIVSSGTQRVMNKQGLMGGKSASDWLLYGATQAVVSMGLTALEGAILDKPGEKATFQQRMDYQNRLAQFRTATFFASALITSAVLAAKDNLQVVSTTGLVNQDQQQAVENNPDNNYMMRLWGNLSAPNGTFAQGLNLFTGANYMANFMRTGSFADVQPNGDGTSSYANGVRNFNAYTEILSDYNGYNVQNAIARDDLWKSMVEANNQISGKPIGYTTGPGGLVVADYMGAPQKVSREVLFMQYILQADLQGLLYHTIVPQGTVISKMHQADIMALEGLAGAATFALVKPKQYQIQSVEGNQVTDTNGNVHTLGKDGYRSPYDPNIFVADKLVNRLRNMLPDMRSTFLVDPDGTMQFGLAQNNPDRTTTVTLFNGTSFMTDSRNVATKGQYYNPDFVKAQMIKNALASRKSQEAWHAPLLALPEPSPKGKASFTDLGGFVLAEDEFGTSPELPNRDNPEDFMKKPKTAKEDPLPKTGIFRWDELTNKAVEVTSAQEANDALGAGARLFLVRTPGADPVELTSPMPFFDAKINSKADPQKTPGAITINAEGTVSGWTYLMNEGTATQSGNLTILNNNAFSPYKVDYTATGTVRAKMSGQVTARADITGAVGLFENGTQKSILAILGKGNTYEYPAGMGPRPATEAGQNDASLTGGFAKQGSSTAPLYTMNKLAGATTIVELNTEGREGGQLQWTLPGLDAQTVAGKTGIVYKDAVVSNNYTAGAKAYFGDTIAKTPLNNKNQLNQGVQLMGAHNTFWGAGLEFGENGILSPLSTSERPNTYWNTLKVSSTDSQGIVHTATALPSDTLQKGNISGWTMIGQEQGENKGWSLDKSYTPLTQTVGINTQWKNAQKQNILPEVNAMGQTNNYTMVFMNKGGQLYSGAQIAATPEGPGRGGPATGEQASSIKVPEGSFNINQLLPGVINFTANKNSQVGEINVDKDAGAQLSLAPMYRNAEYKVVLGQIDSFVASAQGYTDRNGTFVANGGEFVTAANEGGGPLQEGTQFKVNEKGFVDTLGMISKYQRGANGHQAIISLQAQNGMPALVKLGELSFENGGVPIQGSIDDLNQVSFKQGQWQPAQGFVDTSYVDQAGKPTAKLVFTSPEAMPRLPVAITASANHAEALLNSSGLNENGQPLTKPQVDMMANNKNYVVVANGDMATGQKVETSLESNFTGGMALDQRNLNYYSETRLADFGMIRSPNTNKLLGYMGMLNGKQHAYFNNQGAMVSGTGEFYAQKASSNPQGLYLDHAYKTNGQATHGGIFYDNMKFGYVFDDKTGNQSVFVNEINANEGKKFVYAIASKDKQKPTLGSTEYGQLNVMDGKLQFKNVEKLAYIPAYLQAPSDAMAAREQIKASQENQYKAWRENNPGVEDLPEEKAKQLYLEHLRQSPGVMGKVVQEMTEKAKAGGFELTLDHVETAYTLYMMDRTNNPEAHAVQLLPGGMASLQWLTSSLQTPFSASLTQYQPGLILVNRDKEKAVFANVVDEKGNPTSVMQASLGSKIFFNSENGQSVDYFTGKNYIHNTDGKGQFIANSFQTEQGALGVGGYRVKDMALTHSLTNGQVKLDVIENGTDMQDGIYTVTTDGKTTQSAPFTWAVESGNIVLLTQGNTAYVPAYLRTPSNERIAHAETKAAREAQFKAWLEKNPGAQSLNADDAQKQYLQHLSQEKSLMGRITQEALKKNPKATLGDVEKAYDAAMRDPANNPYAHQVDLLRNGMASNQVLISSLQTPFSGSLSQDQRGLILNNTTGQDKTFYANVIDENGNKTSVMQAGIGSMMYFNPDNGQALDYFTGKNYIHNTDGQGQFIAHSFQTGQGALGIGGYRVKDMELTHSLTNGNVKLDVIEDGTEMHDGIYTVTTDGVNVQKAPFTWAVESGNIVLVTEGNTAYVPASLRAPSNEKTAYAETKASREAQFEAWKKTAAAQNLQPGQTVEQKYAQHLSQERSALGRIAQAELKKNPKATLGDVEQAYDTWMQDSTNNPNVHQVGLNADGTASNQWLISTLQTPLSGSLSQDQRGLILVNNTGLDKTFYANVVDEGGNKTSEMQAGVGSKMYFSTDNGQSLEYFTGKNYIHNTDGKGQFIANTWENSLGTLYVGGYRVKDMELTHSLDKKNSNVKLDVLSVGIQPGTNYSIYSGRTDSASMNFTDTQIKEGNLHINGIGTSVLNTPFSGQLTNVEDNFLPIANERAQLAGQIYDAGENGNIAAEWAVERHGYSYYEGRTFWGRLGTFGLGEGYNKKRLEERERFVNERDPEEDFALWREGSHE